MRTELNPIPVGQEPPPLRPSLPTDGGRGQRSPRKADRRNAADRFAELNAFVDFTAGRLSHAAALTWLVLWRDTKPNGTAQTSQADLARRIGANRSTVNRALLSLVKAGLLDVAYRRPLAEYGRLTVRKPMLAS